MARGTIKRLIHDKGFGFIESADGAEYFVHRSAILADWETLREGQAVTFEPGMGAKGPRAEHVELA